MIYIFKIDIESVLLLTVLFLLLLLNGKAMTFVNDFKSDFMISGHRVFESRSENKPYLIKSFLVFNLCAHYFYITICSVVAVQFAAMVSTFKNTTNKSIYKVSYMHFRNVIVIPPFTFFYSIYIQQVLM
ncbi:hypothetical protein HanIR_Chr17g0884541 [Helianthus annuus]|nr:hypothetical protein HanIR_Chr17g0884541 [Helianthus annuus]